MDPLLILAIIMFFGVTLGIALYIVKQKTTGSEAHHTLLNALDFLQKELTEVKHLHTQQRQELYQLQTDSRKELETRLDRVHDQVGKGLSESYRTMQTQFTQTTKLIEEVTVRLTTLDHTNKQVLDFSSQLQKMQDILKNPKQRGILGEFYLESLLGNVLPPESYQRQYGFPDGNIVDAVVFVNSKIIPVDSKFSLENYNRFAECENEVERDKFEKAFVNDLKTRIQETAKYIQPEQGTTDFAFMFIPHEALYYDLLTNKIGSVEEGGETLLQRAAGKYRVIIVSPTNFLAYLQTILQALNAMKIEKNADEIKKRVKELHKHFCAYSELHDKMGKNLATTVNQFNLSTNELKKMSKDVSRITSGEVEELLDMVSAVEKPLIPEI